MQFFEACRSFLNHFVLRIYIYFLVLQPDRSSSQRFRGRNKQIYDGGSFQVEACYWVAKKVCAQAYNSLIINLFNTIYTSFES
jgi:hypothetical protein